ncbi:unnamed protein product [Ambrosiozyma monospora]|uniref:Unnamed protein product n=1 Tax=Ambrosiozyma monospora TaxID=43982 RepID=A0ACB5T300_AMBMO|nr:unnamed protein product [Ambrosiozyma monospora]
MSHPQPQFKQIQAAQVSQTTPLTPVTDTTNIINNDLLKIPRPDENLLNNLYKLPKLNSSISILYGSIQVQNTSHQPLTCESILTTFEGYVTMPIKNTKTKRPELVRRQFLKLLDFGACSGKYHVPNEQMKYPAYGEYDRYDDTYFGFPEDNVLAPAKKYKMYFTFKIPEHILNNSCRHNIASHATKLPPSMGLDLNFTINGDNADGEIFMNDVLGYGRCNVPGSPICLDDHAGWGQSINYCVHVSIVKVASLTPHPSHGNNKNKQAGYTKLNGNSIASGSTNGHGTRLVEYVDKKQAGEYCLMSDAQHFIRLVPKNDNLVFHNPSMDVTATQLADLERCCRKQKEFLTQIAEQRKVFSSRGGDQVSEIASSAFNGDDYSSISGASLDSRKLAQMPRELASFISTTDDEESTVDDKLFNIKSNTDQIETEAVLPLKTKKKLLGFGKKGLSSSSSSSSGSDSGSLLVRCSISKDARLPYIIPKTLRKYSCTDLAFKQKLYDQICTKSIQLTLVFRPSSSHTKPPSTVTINPQLKSYLVTSPYSIPFSFSAKSLIKGGEFSKTKLKELQKQYGAEMNEMKNLSRQARKGIDKMVYYDVNSVLYMKRTETIQDIFKNVTVAPHWKPFNSPENFKTNYFAKVEVELNYDETKSRTSTVLPNFDSCYFIRKHYLNIGVEMKGFSVGKTTPVISDIENSVKSNREALDVPINVIAL